MSSPNSVFSLSGLAIRRHIATLMLTLAIIVLGVFAVFSLPVDLLPSITYPRIGVRLDAPGVSPEVAVDEITRPLEAALSATEGVVQVYSQTREGQISLDLFFEPGGNIDQALNDATATFNRARNQLPDDLETPRLFKFDPSQLPVYEFAVTSPELSGPSLRVFAEEELARELGVVPGVASVNVSGAAQEEVRINVDLQRLQRSGVSLTQVLDALQSRNVDISGGRIVGTESEPLTRTVGRFASAQEIEDLVVGTVSGLEDQSAQKVYLRDVATVIDGTEEERIFVTLNGNPAVKVSVQKQPEANTIEVVDGVKKRLEELRTEGIIPQAAELTPTLDDSVFIRNSVNNVVVSGLIGTVLAAIAVLLFLGSLRQTLIIVLAIPLATMAAIIVMKAFGLSLNVFSLGGLALGVGIVVDNSIVMLETIAEGAGMTPGKVNPLPLTKGEMRNQAIASSQTVESALVASTSTNLVAVLPFLMIGGFIALIFNELILTISFAVAASILVAVTLVPMAASRLLAIRRRSGLGNWLFFREFNRRFAGATAAYARFLSILIRHRLVAVASIFIVFGGSSLWMIGQIPQEILPRINTGQASMFAQFPPGTPLEENQRLMAIVDDILINQPETEYAFTTVGGFLFGSNVNANALRSSSTITLKPNTDVEAFTERVTAELEALNLVDIRLRMAPGQLRGLILSNSPLRNVDVDVVLQGNDADVLDEAGRAVLAELGEKVTLARFRPDADPRQPEVQIRPDWQRATELGLTTQAIGQTVQTALDGAVPTQLQRENRLVDVRVKLDNDLLSGPGDLAQIPLFIDGDRPIRLGDVATIDQGRAPGEIQRINQRPVFLIAGTLVEGASLSEALTEVDQVLSAMEFPPGVSRLPSTAAASNEQLQSSLVILGGLAAFLVFVVMAVQYNSLLDPLVIMFTLPLALAGGILGLYVTQTAIGATVIVGTVLLVGIVVNNAIIMVELANQIWAEEGISREAAILRAAPQRLRPILMTTITTVLGMFPLALGIGQGSELLQPLGIVVFSGLSLATLLTLFLIPCLYVLLHQWEGVDIEKVKTDLESRLTEEDVPTKIQ
ncbi:cation or drug efflux system protein [Synechocystis sp. PCC 6803]|uniref:Cation or drug efflux system protein n=1 Tax=Synechocystis sp. (strain ATCC 27184 / PCC 6803 / Kazusa) TaxID=1111708 RepID=P74461_SYNY3|nr:MULTISPECIES: efflux RND transporter permease subunit [unclassified Synechocystis]BAM54707.1 cation or drug efflux system protein [Synechocystis sp. PCC 6803] [Bacillus subtilis BEST7613]AGF52251.1 cation or drug efflux system protein [Synechocystis sp. PCC 6803]ALJ68196.1 cation transporter [Synechocystis sp. PCC 6803]AVP90040.1 AcrB/AcrD/AcrF family protein [Synechocystis sp. IPPAS B-1465]MBD2617703.1 efflux RND transporter permease subunit [Synechocystis sp. FACHB-898]